MKHLITYNKPLRAVMLAALLLGAFPFVAHAQSDELQSARESVTESAEKITVEADMVARQKALRTVFELTLTEIEELSSKERLGSTAELNNPELTAIRAEYVNMLAGFTHYIKLLQQQLESQNLDLENLKLMASDFKEWRSAYDARTKQMFDLLLLIQARSVLSTANVRANKITSDLVKLEAVVSKADSRSLSRSFESAKKNLASAQVYEDEALTAVLEHHKAFEAPEPVAVSLKQGFDGVFTCMPTASVRSGCELVFRRGDGKYFLLQPSASLKQTYSARDVYQGSGIVLAAAPAYTPDAPVGVIELSAVNQANMTVSAPMEITARVSGLAASPSAEEQGVVQKLIKQEFGEIAQAYQKFFAMSKIANKY